MSKEIYVYMRGLDHQMRMHGITGTQLAKTLNRSIGYQVNINNWKNLKTKATLTSVKLCAQGIGCQPIDLLSEPDMAMVVREFMYTLHTYIDEVKQLRLAIAQLDAK